MFLDWSEWGQKNSRWNQKGNGRVRQLMAMWVTVRFRSWQRKNATAALVVQSLSSVRLCNPTDCSTPGFLVPHHLPELAQTHVRWVGDAIQPAHPLLSPSLLPSIFPSIRVFLNESVLHIRWPKHWSFSFSSSPSNEHSGLISFRID